MSASRFDRLLARTYNDGDAPMTYTNQQTQALVALERAMAMEQQAKIQQETAARAANALGVPWSQIGARVGISKQAAWERWSEDRDGESPLRGGNR